MTIPMTHLEPAAPDSRRTTDPSADAPIPMSRLVRVEAAQDGRHPLRACGC